MNLDAIIQELRELERLQEDLEAEIEAKKDLIKQEMTEQGVDELKGSSWKVTWREVASSRVDTTRLKKELPDVAKAYMTQSTSRRFVLK
ncbi:MAG: hypothetical protein NC548_37795 [Lachnospiraceae bacterium]|nr:hypothetical protein [Lachnospiraceae bacterium]MCM1233007.1 hypothetical protein [Ruminococcus flavefaciens]